jgi:L-threonylcarbamoyladenylate synthase
MTSTSVCPESIAGQVQQAVDLLRAGELVALPTETVYGLGADARNPIALAKIFAAKGRPADHPLIVHLPDVSHLEQWAREIPDTAHLLAKAFWPGPLTLILKRKRGINEVPDLVTGGQDTIGLRVPNHPLALQLLKQFNSGIAAPSANRFGRISPTTAQHVREELGDAVALILDGGPCAVGIESTIVDLSRGESVILRPGIISAEQIEQVLHHHVRNTAVRPEPAEGPAQLTPRVSGSLDAHYAPTTPMRLVSSSQLAVEVERSLRAGQRTAVLSQQNPAPSGALLWQPAASDAGRYAHDLYANLRTLDHAGVDLILVEAPPQSQQWFAVNDRLTRAARGAGI